MNAAVVDPAGPHRLASPAHASLAFAWRALLKLEHVPDRLMDVTFFPVMMVLMFTYLFGGAVAGSTDDYVQYVLPGLLAMMVLTTTQSTGMALNVDIRKGSFDRFASLPIWRPAPLVGALLADLVRYGIGITTMLVVGIAIGFRPEGGVVGMAGAVALLLLFAWSWSWIWTCLGLVARAPETVVAVGISVTFPLSFVSNVFVDPETLPGWLQAFVDVNPLTQLVTALRGLAHGDPATGAIAWVVLTSVAIVGALAPVAVRLYGRER